MKALLVCLLLAGCGGLSMSLTPAGAGVRFTSNSQATAGCRYIGEVHPSPWISPDVMKSGRGLWIVNVRNEAAKIGADTAFAASTAWGDKVLVEGYDCSGVQAAQENQP